MIKYLKIGDYITLLNSVVGSVAVFLLVLYQNYILVSYMIFICLLLDYLDGYVSRKTKRQSVFGPYLDALTDIFCFGFLPGLIILFYISEFILLSLVVFIIIILANILRHARLLAITNTEANEKIGLPNTIVASLVSLIVLSNILLPDYLMGTIMIVLSLLMITPIKYPTHRKLRMVHVMTMILLVLIGLVVSMFIFNLEIFFIGIITVLFGYVFLGPVFKRVVG